MLVWSSLVQVLLCRCKNSIFKENNDLSHQKIIKSHENIQFSVVFFVVVLINRS